MEHLNKQQIVLLTLLVSFVTSIATGIVTVALIDQAPKGVTQTINQIVERTIERVVPSDSNTKSVVTASVINFVDQTAIASDKVSKNVVRIRSKDGKVTGLGLVISKDGIIVTDKSVIAPQGDLVAVFPNGQEFPIQVIQSQINGDIVFITAILTKDKKIDFYPITFSSGEKLGQTVFALSFKNSNFIDQGIIKDVNIIKTSITSTDIVAGSPIFDINGDVIGIRLLSGDEGVFYPVSALKAVIPTI